MTTQMTDAEMVVEMPLDEAMAKARTYASDERHKTIPSVSRTLVMEIDRLRAEIAELRRGWQPIETAPRNGQRILLAAAVGGGRVSVGAGSYSCEPYRTEHDEVIGAEEGFQKDGDECIPSNQECFICWMPLPAAPEPQPAAIAEQGEGE